MTGNVGVGALRKAGFNVLTWDSRGFGNSGGTVTVDSPDTEGRDVSALIDWLAQQPEAQLDSAGDPRMGMTGVSYAGGAQLVTAPRDKRIDAIAPIIAWHSLLTSLYNEDTIKGGWASALVSLGIPTSKNRLDPHVPSAFTSGAATGKLSAEDRAWFDSRGPGAGPKGHVEQAVVAWLKRYVANDAAVDTGPTFEWLADDARWRSAAGYPVTAGAPITATGSGTLALNPADAASGTIATAGRAVNAVNVGVTAPAAAQIVGEPQLSLTYSGTGAAASTYVFAQLVDEQRGVVVGNQATPIPLTLDGQPHTIARRLEAIAASAPKGAKYTLQLTGGTMLYGPVRAAGAITFSQIGLQLPTVGVAALSGGAGLLPTTRTCLSKRRFSIRVRGTHTKVTVAGQRVKVRKGRAIVDLRGKPKGTVKVQVTARRKGKTVRETRVYKTCASRTGRATAAR